MNLFAEYLCLGNDALSKEVFRLYKEQRFRAM